MSPEIVFSISTAAAGLGWLALIAAPVSGMKRSSQVAKLGILLAFIYCIALVAGAAQPQGNFLSLGGVHQLFENRWMLVAGWVHYLCLDLLLGTWIVRDAEERSIIRWTVVPSLMLTFLFGPFGVLTYVIIRSFSRSAR